jgi:hypothetical protein
MVIEFNPKQNFTSENALNGVIPDCFMNIRLWNDIDLQPLAQKFFESGVQVELKLLSNDLNRVSLSLNTPPSAKVVGHVAAQLFESLRSITRSYHPPVWKEGYQGFLQVLTLWVLSQRRQTQVAGL